MGIGWGWDPARVGALSCARPQPRRWQHQRHQSTAGATGWQGQPEPLGPSNERVDTGSRNTRAQGDEGVGFALSITSGCGGSHSRVQTRSCRVGSPSDLPTHPWLLHARPTISVPTWEPPPVLLHTQMDPMTQDHQVLGGLQGRQVLLCKVDSKATAPPKSPPPGPSHQLCVCRVPTFQGHLEPALVYAAAEAYLNNLPCKSTSTSLNLASMAPVPSDPIPSHHDAGARHGAAVVRTRGRGYNSRHDKAPPSSTVTLSSTICLSHYVTSHGSTG